MRALAGEFTLKRLCAVLEVARSSLYYGSAPKPGEDLEPLKNIIRVYRVTFPRAGVRPMYHYVISYYTRYSRRQVRQAYLELGLLRKPRPRKARTTDSRNTECRFPNLLKGLKVERVHQVWVADVTQFLIKRRFAYLALLMDSYSRMIVGWSLSFSNDTSLVTDALMMGFQSGLPEIHHSDQGSTYGSKAYAQILFDRRITPSMAAIGKPEENGQAERLNRTVKEEEVQLSEYITLEQAYDSLAQFILIYNTMRIHQSLGYRAPAEVFEPQPGPP